MPVDVTDSRAVDHLVAHVATTLGSVDILINNAGGEFGSSKAVTELSDEEWRQILSTNLTGAFYCARAAGRHMLNRGWGRVINVTCIYGVRGSVNHAAYAAAKGGLMQFSQALALEWATRGVTVNTLGIGWFEDQPLPQPETRGERAAETCHSSTTARPAHGCGIRTGLSRLGCIALLYRAKYLAGWGDSVSIDTEPILTRLVPAAAGSG